jgi:hypothetical protein
MTIPRTKIILPDQSPWVHCISRCVRRAWLLGKGKDHRRQWAEDRLAYLVGCFAVEVGAYAVMANHLHVVLRMDPGVAASWSAMEVARRWMSVYPRAYRADGTPELPHEAVITAAAQDVAWVAERRTRLANLGWYMKAVKEAIAKRANREDDCTGSFWEGRFTSVPLLDDAALVACMAYVDLNPVRARVVDRPERSRQTGVRARIVARQRYQAARRIRARRSREAAAVLAKQALTAAEAGPEVGLWLAPIARCCVALAATGSASEKTLRPHGWSADDYLQLVDLSGRVLRGGKRGAIPAELAPLLARLDLDVDAWVAVLFGWRSFVGRAVGGLAARTAQAGRLSLAWIKNSCPLFAARADEVAA